MNIDKHNWQCLSQSHTCHIISPVLQHACSKCTNASGRRWLHRQQHVQ